MTQTNDQSQTQASAPAMLHQHPGIFTAEEAMRYLKLPTMRSFNDTRRRHNVRGQRFGNVYRFSREELDALRLKMFGLDRPAKKSRTA